MRAGVRKRVSWPGLLALFAAGAGLALGCGWVGTEHSVRFNRWHSKWQFSRLPALPFDARERTTPDWREVEVEPYDRAGSGAEETDALWTRAEAAAIAGDFAEARKLLRDYLGRTGAGTCEEYRAPLDCRATQLSARPARRARGPRPRRAPRLGRLLPRSAPRLRHPAQRD